MGGDVQHGAAVQVAGGALSKRGPPTVERTVSERYGLGAESTLVKTLSCTLVRKRFKNNIQLHVFNDTVAYDFKLFGLRRAVAVRFVDVVSVSMKGVVSVCLCIVDIVFSNFFPQHLVGAFVNLQ